MVHPVRPISPSRYREGERYRANPLADGETFKAGAPIVLGANGVFAEAGADPDSIVGFATAGAEDYAWKRDTFGTVVPSVPVALADQEFRGTLGSADTDSTPAVVADKTAVIGEVYGLVKDAATGHWVLNINDTTDGIAKVVSVDYDVEDGDSNIPVNFVIVAEARDVIA